MKTFDACLREHSLTLNRDRLQVLQVNLGRKCNQTCQHCHVDAAPWRTESMDAQVAGRVVDWITRYRPAVVDLTGGAPELNEHFCLLVEAARRSGCHVIDRNNLTIIESDSFAWLPGYLAAHGVEVIASLPCYLGENVDAQRGDGVFQKSIRALKKLNAVGYGTRLPLGLVYNPLGPKLPPQQCELEAEYRDELHRRYGVVFSRLLTLTNQPIARFAEELRRTGKWDEYLSLLVDAFNPGTVDGLMCRSTLSVGWRGELHDCDFNQMLGLPLGAGGTRYLWDLQPEEIEGKGIGTGIHCFACTAGQGSSCGGVIEESGAGASAVRGARGDSETFLVNRGSGIGDDEGRPPAKP